MSALAAQPRAASLTLLAGGRVWSHDAPGGIHSDILVEGDTIKAVAPPGSFAALAVEQRFELAHRAVIPGLVIAQTRSHGGLSKGVGDRWTLELLLHHGAWAGGSRVAAVVMLCGDAAAQITGQDLALDGGWSV